MRSPSAHALGLLVAICLAAPLPRSASADTIYLKNGKQITTTHVVQENGQVSYETSAGRMSLPVSIVDRVVHEDESLDSTAGTPADKAAHLPIAPPNAVTRPADDETARAAVRDGSIDLNLLAKLESEADANPTPTAVARVVAAESAAAQFGISVGDFEQAATHNLLDHARRIDSDSPDVAKLSGWAYYGLNRVEDAVSEWKRALLLKPDVEVQNALEK